MSGRLEERLSERTLLARGSVSACFRARETALGRVVLIKTLQGGFASDGDLRARFAREARAVARLDHPNIVRLLEFGEDSEVGLYMMLEWVDGETLSERLKRGPLTSEELQMLAGDLLSGLGALHRAGIVHRDIKPDNILLRKDGVYKLTDFSLAALCDEPRLTHHDGIVGTPAYMSPEQAAGKIADARSDLYAAGVVLYEAATGSNPFAAGDVIETLRRIRQIQPDLEGHPELSPEMVQLLRACLEKNPGKRPQQISDVQKLLPSRSRYVPTPKRHGFVSSVAAGLSVLAVMALVIAIARHHELMRTPPTPVQTTEQSGGSATDSARVADSLAKATTSTKVDKFADTVSHAVQPPITSRENPRERTDNVAAHADSADVTLQVEPWAHVLCDGARIGTSPFRRAVRLPVGRHVLTFENAALPRVDLPVTISAEGNPITVNLAEHVVTLKIDVTPWGEVFMNDERIGVTPFVRPLFFPPGTHTIRIVHTQLPTVERTFTAAEGDTVSITADLDHSDLVLKHSSHGRSEANR